MAFAADAPPLRSEWPVNFSPGWASQPTRDKERLSHRSITVAGNVFEVSCGRAQKDDSGRW